MKNESNNNNNTLEKILVLWPDYTIGTEHSDNDINCVSCAAKHGVQSRAAWLRCIDGEIDLGCPGCPWE